MATEVVAPSTADVRRAFGIEIGDLRPYPGGFEADAFSDGRWFVKVWRETGDTDAALGLTADLAARGLPVPPAQRALDGTFTADHQGRRYAVFPFVAGRRASWDDAAVIAAAMRSLHAVSEVELPSTEIDEACVATLRERRDHPWIGSRRDELMEAVDRLETLIERARRTEVPRVVCHRDLFPHNVLVDDAGRLAALLDWGSVVLGPREHDVFLGLCGPDPTTFLTAYGARDLSMVHLEYARLARSLRDLSARIVGEVDLDGINTWGFAGLRRVDADLALARPFCADG